MTRPPRISLLFEKGFELRKTPSYVGPPRRTDGDRWHKEPSLGPDGRLHYYWHASQVAGCTREQMLKRAGLANDGNRLDGEMIFAWGHTMHGFLEEFAGATVDGVPLPQIVYGPRWELIGSEAGGAHPELPLKARPDLVFKWEGVNIIQDLKTENSAKWREKEAKENKMPDAAKDEHKLQIACNALVQEALGLVEGTVDWGLVTYCSSVLGKSEWVWKDELFPITLELRERVKLKLIELDESWSEYTHTGVLPPRMPNIKRFGQTVGHWKCRARGAMDERGKFCAARSQCMALPPAPHILVKELKVL